MKKFVALNFIALFALTACGTPAASANPASSQPASSVAPKDAYSFVYDVNYEGGTNRTISVKSGQKASYWNAKRTNYELVNWYTAKDFATPYDFNTSVSADTTVFASWKEKTVDVPVTVTFNFNYDGAGAPTTATGYVGKTLAASLAPDPKRLGYSVEGWYLEAACTTKFNFDADLLTADLTLYAKYTSSVDFQYDSDGNIIFDNVAINLAVNDNWVVGGSSSAGAIVKAFNVKYRNKIAVTIVDNSTTDNSLIDVKFHQTNVINRSGDYYRMADVLNLAKVTFNKDDYYADQIADCYKNGILNSYPLCSIVPGLVYNKALMAKYSTAYAADGTLPKTYAEFHTVMEAAKNDGKYSIITDRDWPWFEGASNLPWSQNDMMLYDYSAEKGYYTKWADSANMATAVSACKSLYDTFNTHSTVGSAVTVGDAWSADTWNQVKTGAGLFALTSISSRLDAAYDSSTTGIMPVTNFFNITNSTNSKNFIGNYSIGVTSHDNENYYKVAAAGVFADFVAKNWKTIGDCGVYPASKTIQQGEFAASTNVYAVHQRLLGDPASFITLPGHASEFTILNDDKSGNVSYLLSLDSWSESDIENFVNSVADSVKGLIQ